MPVIRFDQQGFESPHVTPPSATPGQLTLPLPHRIEIFWSTHVGATADVAVVQFGQ
ncbi:MAG: hypothetical protein U0795_27025 [Pirellulales bacterium]